MRPRRQTSEAVAALADAGELVMPLDLVAPAQSWSAASVRPEARRHWFRDHGIDPGDWSAVYPVLVRSGTVHGFPLALERSRLRAEMKGPTRRVPNRL